jgi:hypothetical protein
LILRPIMPDEGAAPGGPLPALDRGYALSRIGPGYALVGDPAYPAFG